VGVAGVVSRSNSDEVAEAEPFQSSARVLVLFCGEECDTQSFFQVGMDCRADDDGLIG
jgi:hypothetical protein